MEVCWIKCNFANDWEVVHFSITKWYTFGLPYTERDQGGKRTYILIDGLQRGNCIKKYMNNPTEFFYDSNISDEFCKTLLQEVNADKEQNYPLVRGVLTKFIKEPQIRNYHPMHD